VLRMNCCFRFDFTACFVLLGSSGDQVSFKRTNYALELLDPIRFLRLAIYSAYFFNQIRTCLVISAIVDSSRPTKL
jgi:hypothetical protein